MSGVHWHVLDIRITVPMENEAANVVDKIQVLGDLELACLLSFVADQHAFLVEAEDADIETLENELQLIAHNTFGLASAVLRCNESTTLDDFANGILVGEYAEDDASPILDSGRPDYLTSRLSSSNKSYPKRPRPYFRGSETRIADVIIATRLNLAHEQVQIQALELIRSKRISSRTQFQVTSKNFLFIPLLEQGTTRLSSHLIDHLFLSVIHLPNDPLIHSASNRSSESLASVIRTPPSTPGLLSPTRRSIASSIASPSKKGTPLITSADIKLLANAASQVSLSPDLRAYIHDIIIFLRTHRALALSPSDANEPPGPGVSALATRHMHILVRALASLHGVGYVTPSLVCLATRKVYPHRLRISAPERDRALLYGGEAKATKKWLSGVTVEDVIDEVLASVEPPL